MYNNRTLNADKDTHATLKLESGRRLISIKKLLKDAVAEYFENHKFKEKIGDK